MTELAHVASKVREAQDTLDRKVVEYSIRVLTENQGIQPSMQPTMGEYYFASGDAIKDLNVNNDWKLVAGQILVDAIFERGKFGR